MRTPKRRLVRRPGEPTTSRRATSAFAARLAGSVVGVAGITLMGAGTFGSPGSVFASGNSDGQVSDFTCSSEQVCIHTSQVPTTGDHGGCADIADLLNSDGLDSTDSYWHFVIPASQGFEFSGTAFNTNFSGGSSESVTFVQQRKDGGYKGVVVEADSGVTLNWASVPDSAIMVENSEDSRDLNLSSSCAGDATSSSTTSSSDQTTTVQTSTSSHETTTVTDPCTILEEVTPSHDETCTTTTTHSTTSTDNHSTSSTSTTSSTSSTSTLSSATTSSKSGTTSSTSSMSASSTTPVTTSSESSTSNTSNASGATTSVSSSTATQPPTTSVLGAGMTTPSTGADIEFGFGIALLLGGGGVMIGATRINRNKRQ